MVSIQLPYSKSIRARVAIINALSGASSRWCNDSDDTRIIVSALSEIDAVSTGNDSDGKPIAIDLHHSGTALRFLLAYCAAKSGAAVILTGSPRLCQRPIADLVAALRNLGADIEYLENEGFAPVLVRGKKLTVGEVSLSADVSSQFVSALMLIAPCLDNGLTVNLIGKQVSQPYIRLTEYVMKRCGVSVEYSGDRIRILPGKYDVGKIETLGNERDWSAAMMWFAAVAITRKPLLLQNLSSDSKQPDRMAAQVFAVMGVTSRQTPDGVMVEWDETKRNCWFRVDCNDIPDSVIPIVVAAVLADIKFDIDGIETLKSKECDRANALVEELYNLGYLLEYNGVDRLKWRGERVVQKDEIPTLRCHSDHRMAMALSLFRLVRKVELDHPEVVSKSYDMFYNELNKIIK